MNITEKQDLITVLKQLALGIKKEIDDSRSRGMIQPEEKLYYRWNVDKFQYTEKGMTESSAHGEYITKKTWFRASIKIEEFIKKSDEYSSALEILDLLRNNLEKPGERISIKRSNMRRAMDALEGSIS